LSILFHTGYPKTGTRWLQERLFPHIKNYNIVPRGDIYKHLIEPDAYSFPQTDIETLREYFGTENLIFSLHELIGTNFQSDLHGLLSKEHAIRIQRLYPDAQIIIFIRNQMEIIASAYAQYIKGGGTYKISKYLNNPRFKKLTGFPLVSLSFYNYHNIIDHYNHLFGSKKIHVYLFEEFENNPEKFVREFGHAFQIDIDFANIDYEILNPSYRKSIIRMLRFLNHFTEKRMLNKHYFFHLPRIHTISLRILKKLNKYRIFGNKYKLSHELNAEAIKTLSDYYKQSNKILIEKYKLPIDKYAYPLP